MDDYRHLPEPARGLARALRTAVDAARAGDEPAYRTATERLAGHEPAQVGLVAGETVRLLLEDAHPDGLDADDLRAVLTRCVRSATAWYPGLEPTTLSALLAGALGVHDADGQPIVVDRPDAAGHAPLLIADLAVHAAHPVRVYLDAALSTIATTQTMDLP